MEFVGAGGMGEVYRGVHVRTGATVAVKVLTSAGLMPALVERFRNEARIQAALKHPNITALQEFLEHEGTPSIVMEFVDGETFEQLTRRRGAPPQAEALALAASVVDAVGYLHERGIIHRDIKASNVKVGRNGVVKLLDFGIAKGPGSPALTTHGAVIGTLQSLAPEQLSGAPATRRTDIWSLGVLLFELATGRHPFSEGGADNITSRIRAAQFTTPSDLQPGLNAEVDRIISRCLRIRPRDRYGSCEELQADLRALLEPQPLMGPPLGGSSWAAALLPRLQEQMMAVARQLTLPQGVGRLRPWAREHLALVLAMTGALAAVLFLGSTLWDRPAPPPPPVVPTANLPAAQRIRVVMVNTVAGIAEVWRNDQRVGSTPFRINAVIGDTISLLLRREGFEDEPVRFEVTEGRSEYSIVMRPRRTGRGDDRTPVPMNGGESVLALAWFGLPWRRRRAPPAPVGGVTEVMLPLREVLAAEARIIVGVATDPGCVRPANEDAVRVVRPTDEGVESNGLLAAVLDGMGGHAAGEIASGLAADELARRYADSAADPGESLARAVRAANQAVYSAARRNAAVAGMGTTCTALVVRGGLAWCAHVGDSRCYLVRGGDIFLMTEDHSAVMALVRDGIISRDEARQHPDKNVISRALGSHSDVEVTVWPRPFVVRPGDQFLLCSDGLYDLTSDDELGAIVRELPPHLACERLVALARERGAPDNVSVVILAVPEPRRDNAPRATRELPVVTE